MNDDIKEILDYISDRIIPNEKWNKVRDYITNLQHTEDLYNQLLKDYDELQQENERLKEENKHIFANVNDNQLLISNAMNWAEAQDYKSRCEKAVEYIGEYNDYCDKEVCDCTPEYFEYLLNILNGKE